MIQTTGRPSSLATVGLKPEAGRARRGREAQARAGTTQRVGPGSLRENFSPSSEKHPGWLCRNDSGSGWKLDLRATGRALASDDPTESSESAGTRTLPGWLTAVTVAGTGTVTLRLSKYSVARCAVAAARAAAAAARVPTLVRRCPARRRGRHCSFKFQVQVSGSSCHGLV